MNTKDFVRLGIPLGEATRRAIDFVSRFILSGGDKTRLEEELKVVLANPSAFVADQLRGELAKALLDAPPPPRQEPIKYRQWGEGLEHDAVMQMEKACLLPVAVAGALMPDAHVGYGLPIGGVLATENAVIPYAVLYRNGDVPAQYAGAFFGAMAVYFGTKGILRRRAGALAANAVTLMPSALWPWRFFGVEERGTRVLRFQVNAITGSQKPLAEQEVLDAAYAGLLAGVPEFVLMRGLSPAYHVVSANPTEAGNLLLCRDLRTRNFGTIYGDLEVLLDKNNGVLQTTFHV